MSEPKKKLTGKERARRNKIRKYLSWEAITIYFVVAVLILYVVGLIYVDSLPNWYIYVLQGSGLLAFIVCGLKAGEESNNTFSAPKSRYLSRNNNMNGKTLFSSGTKQNSGWNGVGYNDDYERGNREIWKNKWDQEAWNDHEYSCSHDDPWECRDENHF